MNWQLHIRSEVVAYLTSLRESGHDLRTAIFSLMITKDGIPADGVTQYEQGLFVWEVAKHLVTYRIHREAKRINVLDVNPIPPQEPEEEN